MKIRLVLLCVSVVFLLAACQGAAGQSAQPQSDVAQAQGLSAAEQIQAALAQTQLAQINKPLSDTEIQTAIASTQMVVTPMPLVNQQIAMAVLQTQEAVNASAFSDAQVQTAIAQVQVAPPDNAISPEMVQIAMVNTEQALAPQGLIFAEAATPTPELLQVQSATMDDFSGAYVYSHGPVLNHKYFFTVQMAAEIHGKYHAKIGDTPYKCQVTSVKPDRFYCQGASVKGGTRTIKMYEDGTESLVFTADFVFPEWTATRPVSATRCPYRSVCPPCLSGTCGCCGSNIQ